jgi:hypothetical protein
MRRALFVLPFAAILAVGMLVPTSASHNPDQHRKMDELFTSPNAKTNSDLAFWGDHAFVGYYSGADATPAGGVRIFDISNPASPQLVRDFPCDGLQADPIVYDRNGNGVADLLMLAVDRTMASPECGAPRTAHNDPMGWEGVRVFEMSDDPANPFATITQVKAVYTDCGAHTITMWPGELEETGNLLVYVSSYPLRPGPTCGTIPPTGSTTPPYQNTANPYDEDPGSPNSGLHGVIQVVEVPLANPAASNELGVQPAIHYPNDPDGINDWTERGLAAPGVLEPAAIACHDINVHVEHRLAGAACADQGQVWHIDENGIPDTEHPILVADDEVTSGGAGDIPGAVDFFHSVMFDNDATVVNWVDESFGSGCPPRTTYQPRPWNPAGGTHQTGRMFFSDIDTGRFLSEFSVGDIRPDPSQGEYCSAHMGMAVMGIERDLLVNAWYTGGVDVIDFTNPTRLRELAYYDPAQNSGTWSAYPYTGPMFQGGSGLPVYASDGVTNNALAEGMVVYRAMVPRPSQANLVDHLNPQTMD